MEFKLAQVAKVEYSILVNRLPIVTDSRPSKTKNAWWPTEVTRSGMVSEVVP